MTETEQHSIVDGNDVECSGNAGRPSLLSASPNQPALEQTGSTGLSNPVPSVPDGCRWYLAHFAHKLLDFRQAELESLATIAGMRQEQLKWQPPASVMPEMNPFWRITLQSDEVAARCMQRSMLTKALVEVWGEGSTWEELQQAIEAYPEHLKAPWLAAGRSYKVVVDSYGSTIGQKQQLELLQKIIYIPFKGVVNLKQPDVRFWLMVVDVRNTMGHGEADVVPYRLYFGRMVATYNHSVAQRYTLTTRPYIGPTSMNAEMACIMCNQARVQAGQLVLDPYMGTGSIGVAMAELGAQVMGTDIDIKVIKIGKTDAQGTPVDVTSNFDYYGTRGRLAGLLRLDIHTHPFRRDLEEVFHAIIGDPPYGVRAGGKKSVHKDVVIMDRATHMPSTDAYSMGECLRDLLAFAARMLVLHGRLVFFMPATPDTYHESEIPSHPALRLVHNSEQLLTTRYSRRLITLEKVSAFDAQAENKFLAANPDPTMAIDRLHDKVYESYDRDASGAVIYPEGACNHFRWRGKMI